MQGTMDRLDYFSLWVLLTQHCFIYVHTNEGMALIMVFFVINHPLDTNALLGSCGDNSFPFILLAANCLLGLLKVKLGKATGGRMFKDTVWCWLIVPELVQVLSSLGSSNSGFQNGGWLQKYYCYCVPPHSVPPYRHASWYQISIWCRCPTVKHRWL